MTTQTDEHEADALDALDNIENALQDAIQYGDMEEFLAEQQANEAENEYFGNMGPEPGGDEGINEEGYYIDEGEPEEGEYEVNPEEYYMTESEKERLAVTNFAELQAVGFYTKEHVMEHGAPDQASYQLYQTWRNAIPRDIGEKIDDDLLYAVGQHNYIAMSENTYRRVVSPIFYVHAARMLNAYKTLIREEAIAERQGTTMHVSKLKSKSFGAGAAFFGTKQIVEFENEDVYCPTSAHCMLKCVEKFIQLVYGVNMEIPKTHVKATMSLQAYRKTIKQFLADNLIGGRRLTIEDTPKIFKPVIPAVKLGKNGMARNGTRDSGTNFVGYGHKTFTKDKTNVYKYAILLMPISTGTDVTSEYHAVLAKNTPNHVAAGYKRVVSESQLNYRIYHESIKLEKVTTLKDTTTQMTINPPKYGKVLVFAYDYETYTDAMKTHVPVGVSVLNFDIGNEKSIEEHNAISLFGENCPDRMIDYVIYICQNMKIYEAQLFAHNGGKFDTVLSQGYMTKIKWERKLEAGGGIKYLEGKVKVSVKPTIPGSLLTTNEYLDPSEEVELTLVFKDTLPFVNSNLKEACKTFKTRFVKMDFDIGSFTKEKYESTEEWKEYMKYDTLALAGVMCGMEKQLNKLAQSMVTCNGMASASMHVAVQNSAPQFREVRMHSDNVTSAFVKEAQYGGRIIHWMKEFISIGAAEKMNAEGEHVEATTINCPILGSYKSNGVISLDVNSLYPFSMRNFDFPYGFPSVTNQEMSFEEFQNMIRTKVHASFKPKNATDHKLYIAEVSVDAGNIRFPIIPYRTDEGNLIYPCGKFRGIYTSVEIDEMLREGYAIERVHRAVIYPNRCNMFRQLIDTIYGMRLTAKTNGDKSLDNALKILLNSIYGKFSECIKSYISFAETRNEVIRLIQEFELANGQKMRKYKMNMPKYTKPHQIGAFILSYSRSHVNKLIRGLGRENIMYGDTDSIYCTIEAWEKYCRVYRCAESNELGAYKNDYDSGTLIETGMFIDLKRYFITFNKPYKNSLYKAKFVGLSFKNDNTIRDYGVSRGMKFISPTDIDFSSIMMSDAELKSVLKEFKMKKDSTEMKAIRRLYKELSDRSKGLVTTGEIRLVQEKWKRVMSNVVTNRAESCFSINPSKRNVWTEAEPNVAYPIGYDFTLPRRDTKDNDRILDKNFEHVITEPEGGIIKHNKLYMNHPMQTDGEDIRLYSGKLQDMTGFVLTDEGDLYKIIETYDYKTKSVVPLFYPWTCMGVCPVPKDVARKSVISESTKAVLSLPGSVNPMGIKQTKKQVLWFDELLRKNEATRLKLEKEKKTLEAAKNALMLDLGVTNEDELIQAIEGSASITDDVASSAMLEKTNTWFLDVSDDEN